MRRLHELHHRRELMQTHNFNLVFPLMDWWHGTLHWEAETVEERAMSRMQHRIEIARAPAATLAYAASPSHWPQWHPSSLRVDGASGPLPAGARFEEDIHAGGRAGHLSWEVVEYQPGRLWRANARGDHGLHLRLSYECRPSAAGSHFVRTLEYTFDGWSMRLANLFLLRRRIERESAESMRRLRRAAEALIPREEEQV